jgi:hypothetical protein
MDEPLVSQNLDSLSDVDPAVVEQTSAEYLGRWNRLVSTTNWEKGRIVSQWRMQLMGEGAPTPSYSDEAWSRRVGNVSSQHVGRLRRVYEQFGEVYQQYEGLYWSHFLTALDWSDAEMWLEGAIQNSWSVSQMRTMRWEALGGVPDEEPSDEEPVTAETDEDVDPEPPAPPAVAGSVGVVTDPAEAEEEDSAPFDADGEAEDQGDASAADEPAEPAVPVRPFENMPTLPGDLQDAFEAFKLAILNHKVAGWQEVSCDAVLATLESLKQLALAPSEA